MSDPGDVHPNLDVHRNLDHCMQSIMGASEAMPHDMHDAAMRLGAAEMMLASASYAVHRYASALTRTRTQPDSGAEPAGEGS